MKHSLIRAYAQRSKYRDLKKSVHGLVFLGTPHCSTKDKRRALHDSYGRILQLGQCRSRDRPDDDRHDLTGVCRKFDEISGDMHIISIHESRPTKFNKRMRRHSQIVGEITISPLHTIELTDLRSWTESLPGLIPITKRLSPLLSQIIVAYHR